MSQQGTWQYRPDYQVIQVPSQYGLTPMEATLRLYSPKRQTYDAGRLCKIVSGGSTVFIGILGQVSWDQTPSSYTGDVVCNDIVCSWLQRVQCGQHGATYRYVRADGLVQSEYRTGQVSNCQYIRKQIWAGEWVHLWTVYDILVDLLRYMPAELKSVISLGNTTVLQTISQLAGSDGKLPLSFDFTGTSLFDGIKSCITAYGDVQPFIRYQDNTAYLDFYRFTDLVSAGVTRIAVPSTCRTGAVTPNGKISEIKFNDTRNDNINRVIVKGKDGAKSTISLFGPLCFTTSPAGAAAISDWTLIPAWDRTQMLTVSTPKLNAAGNVVSQSQSTYWVEDYVLRYGASCTQKGSEYYRPECEHVFRRYWLPEQLRGASISINGTFDVMPSKQDLQTYYAQREESQDELYLKSLSTTAYFPVPECYEQFVGQNAQAMVEAAIAHGYRVPFEWGMGYDDDYLFNNVIVPKGTDKKAGYCYSWGYETDWLADRGAQDGYGYGYGYGYGSYSQESEQYGYGYNKGMPMYWALDALDIIKAYSYNFDTTAASPIYVPRYVRAVGVKFDKYYVTLAEPAMVPFFQVYKLEGTTRDIYREAEFIITCQIEDKHRPVCVDTGVVTSDADDLQLIGSTTGSTAELTKDFTKSEMLNSLTPLYKPSTGEPVSAPCVVYLYEEDLTTDDEIIVSSVEGNAQATQRACRKVIVTDPYILKDDTQLMSNIAQAYVSLSRIPERSVSITFPYVCDTLRVGSTIMVTGADVPLQFRNRRLVIARTTTDYGKQYTTVDASSAWTKDIVKYLQ